MTAFLRRHEVPAAAAGLVVLAATWVWASGDAISSIEEDTFRFVNDWPDWLETPIWPVMQAGAIAAVGVVALVAAVLRRYWLAARVLGAGFAAWLLAKVVKEIVGRGRPEAFLDDIHLRPAWEGLGFVSGHAAVAFSVAAVMAGVVGGKWRAAVWAVAVATAVLRLYTAAHLPLDVIGGAGLGIALGMAARVALPDRK